MVMPENMVIVDADLLAWFKAHTPDYETQINAVILTRFEHGTIVYTAQSSMVTVTLRFGFGHSAEDREGHQRVNCAPV